MCMNILVHSTSETWSLLVAVQLIFIMQEMPYCYNTAGFHASPGGE